MLIRLMDVTSFNFFPFSTDVLNLLFEPYPKEGNVIPSSRYTLQY